MPGPKEKVLDGMGCFPGHKTLNLRSGLSFFFRSMNKIRKESTNRVPKLNIEPWPLQAVSLLAYNIDSFTSSVKKKISPFPEMPEVEK